MPVLSIARDGNLPFVMLTNLYLTSPFTTSPGARVPFELLKADAAGLQKLAGAKQLYYLEDTVFWGQLNELESCVATDPTLAATALVLNKETVRGEMLIIGTTDTSRH